MAHAESFWKLSHLDDVELESRLASLVGSERTNTARVVAHLAEVLDRRLHLQQAFPNMTAYCREKLGLREDDAGRRIVAARLARRFPELFAMLDCGEVSLSVVCKLKHYLSDDNRRPLLAAVRGRSYREVEAWLAASFPRQDVRSSVRKLPTTKQLLPVQPVQPGLSVPPVQPVQPVLPPSAPATVDSPAASLARSTEEAASSGASPPAAPSMPDTASARPPRPADRGITEPLSAERHRIQFSAGSELRAKLERALDLMSHANPSGDFAPIFERALDLLIADLEKKRFGKTAKPNRRSRPAKPERITNQTRREVAERDDTSCAFVDDKGRRCGARAFVQLDHRQARGRGGGSGTDNIRHLCAAHNRLEAERVYGRAHIERAIANRRARRPASSSEAGSDPLRSGSHEPETRCPSSSLAGRKKSDEV